MINSHAMKSIAMVVQSICEVVKSLWMVEWSSMVENIVHVVASRSILNLIHPWEETPLNSDTFYTFCLTNWFQAFLYIYKVKKVFVFLVPVGMSLTKLFFAGNNLIIPGQGEFG
jgi:hypothetical protein